MRRRGRPGLVTIAALLLLGAGAGAAVLSVVLRSREPAMPAAVDPDLTIEVLNGCGSEGAADRVAMLLRGAGYRVDFVGNADHFHYREDVVIARTVGLARAAPVARVLGEAAVVEQRLPGHLYDVTVVVGKLRSLAAAVDQVR